MNTDKIIDSLRKEIEGFTPSAQTEEIGEVLSVGDGIALVSGLSKVGSMEVVEFSGQTKGLALNLMSDVVGVVILGPVDSVKEGDKVKRTKKTLSIPVGENILGRVVNAVGEPIDGAGKIETKDDYPVERVASGVMSRQPVNVPMETGIKAIDAMIPIGRGQRELIIGDRQTGKTTIAIDTILNQKGKGVVCVYVAIGQKESKVARIIQELKSHGAMDYTTVVLAGASAGPAFSYLAPYAGVAIAEYFMDQGKDALIVYDDLSKHAVSYREISLLLKRPPGREAYPGDVFYLHSRLLERACRRNEASGGGSITALPIIETQAGDISAYIPTNVISITDGQIFLETNLFYKGIRPAVNVGLSVSRVGGSAQKKAMKKVAGKIKLSLAQFRELEAFSQFSSDLDQETKKQIERGRRLVELLKQPPSQPISTTLQTAMIYTATNGYVDDVEVSEIGKFESDFYDFLNSAKASLLAKIDAGWGDDVEAELKEAIEEFKKTKF